MNQLNSKVLPETQDTGLDAAADRFNAAFAQIDRRLRQRRVVMPDARDLADASAAFRTLVADMTAVEAVRRPGPDELERFRRKVSVWLLRSDRWCRAAIKPHGFAGDCKTIELLYGLAGDGWVDPLQPATATCLDHLLRTEVASVSCLWERRRWLKEFLLREYQQRRGALRLIDVASGGALYVLDFLAAISPGRDLHITLVDQDPAAVSFARARFLPGWSDRVRIECASLSELPGLIASARPDVALSAGLFDYLPDAMARALLGQLAEGLSPGGAIAFTNYHPADPSRLVKEWLVDWRLIYREEDPCRRLFPAGFRARTELSSNGALVFATGRAAERAL
jgi:hypothetical protein